MDTSLDALSSELLGRGPDPQGNTPELTILVPTLNEELTVGLSWTGAGRASIAPESTRNHIVDNSSDSTPQSGRARGASGHAVAKRAGRAYQEAIPLSVAST